MVRFATLSDGVLLREARRDADAFGEFYARYETLIAVTVARRVTDAEVAADLTAETFARALVNAGKFRAPDDAAAAGWLLAIAERLVVDYWRRGEAARRARARLGVDPLDLGNEAIERVERLADIESARPLLERVLANLPADQRDAIRAYVLQETSYEAIAAEAGVPESTIRQRVSRGLARMRSTLEEQR